MDSETYQEMQEIIVSEGALRAERKLVSQLQEHCENLQSLLTEVQADCKKAFDMLDRYYDVLPMQARSGLYTLEDVLLKLEKAGPCPMPSPAGEG